MHNSNGYSGQILLKTWLLATSCQMICSYSKTELLYYTKQQTTVYISKNIHKKKVRGKKTLRWTRFHWTKVEKFCFHDEIATRVTASKCPSVTLVRSLDLFSFMIEKACSQQYMLANCQIQIFGVFNNTRYVSYSSRE